MIEKTKLIHRDLIEGNLVMIDNEESWPQLKGKVLKIVDSYIAKSKLITANFPKSKRIVIVVDEDGTEYDQLDEFIRPIPLSEDVLVKLGFTYDAVYQKYHKYLNLHEYSTESLSFRVIEGFICFEGIKYRTLLKHIKHAHTLQNCFHSLTGEELVCTS